MRFPPVTIIMPIRNEAGFIQRSLGAVLAQNYPEECLQVIVADGMSSDGTREIVREMVGEYPRASLIDNPGRIVPTALNAALAEAQGEVIIRVDGHCQIAPDYVQRCVEALERTGADCVGGPMVTVGETDVAEGIALAQSSFFGVGGVAFRTGSDRGRYVDTVAFGAYRREVFDRIGTFDEELVRNQDDEFNFRLTQAGGKIWLDPSIRSVYYSRASLPGLWRQYFEYGLYKVRLIQKRGAVPSWRHLVPVTFVLSLLASLLLALFTGQRRWALSVAGPYAAANLAASAWTARNRWRLFPFLPLAFATLHMAYGLGFLSGLWRWRGCWQRNGSRDPSRPNEVRTRSG
jgi:glycosyltransferase involved in cell wall biosynthesis